MKIRFGDITSSEIAVMLEASSESGEPLAESILVKKKGNWFDLTNSEAEYLRDNLNGDADRVAQACGDAAGRAFEKAGEKLDQLIQ